ncbi:PadR family transcriptional regulator [Arthrobacter flavus]|uniref:PadR family transcriptional regulator n=1 Tax=Arthrobacter flavus TaxID=95172 RepID=A0ABW4Q4L2_9MICC
MTNHGTPIEWQRSFLSTGALAVLERGRAHGYAVAQDLQSLGFTHIKGGTLYPVLNKLEQQSLVVSDWQEGIGGPGRRVYTLTEEGADRLREARESWGPFATVVMSVLEAGPARIIDTSKETGTP